MSSTNFLKSSGLINVLSSSVVIYYCTIRLPLVPDKEQEVIPAQDNHYPFSFYRLPVLVSGYLHQAFPDYRYPVASGFPAGFAQGCLYVQGLAGFALQYPAVPVDVGFYVAFVVSSAFC
jgi:hypothetical protein